MLYLAALCALAYLPLSRRDPSLGRSVVKTSAVAVLVVIALPGPIWLVVALAFCALGDWLLSRPGDKAFMGGVGAFAAGHLSYVVLFLTTEGSDISHIAQFATVLFLVFGGIMARLIAPHAGDLRLPVLIYIPIIMAMGIAALTLPPDIRQIALPAALAFMASDSILAIEKFRLPQDHSVLRWTSFAIWTLYWGAQVGFLMAFT